RRCKNHTRALLSATIRMRNLHGRTNKAMSFQSWGDYAEYHCEKGLDHLERKTKFEERSCVARIVTPDHSGENRFYVAPAEGAACFAWGDWHGRVETDSPDRVVISETADDATYTFADGGAYFPSRNEANAAIYRWIHRELTLRLESRE